MPGASSADVPHDKALSAKKKETSGRKRLPFSPFLTAGKTEIKLHFFNIFLVFGGSQGVRGCRRPAGRTPDACGPRGPFRHRFVTGKGAGQRGAPGRPSRRRSAARASPAGGAPAAPL